MLAIYQFELIINSLTMFINLKFNFIFIFPHRELQKRFKGKWKAYLHLYKPQ